MSAYERAESTTPHPRPRTLDVGARIVTAAEDRSLLPDPQALGRCVTAIAGDRDRQAFAVLYRHFAPRVKSYAIRLGAASLEAEELAQETLMTVWRKAALFDPAKAAASTWIFAIARNLFIDARRRSGRAAPLSSIAPESEPADPSTPHDALEAIERDHRVREAVARLPPEQREIVRLSYFTETPQTEIAEKLGIPLGTVKSRMRLAAEKLRQHLDDCR